MADLFTQGVRERETTKTVPVETMSLTLQNGHPMTKSESALASRILLYAKYSLHERVVETLVCIHDC